MVLRLLVKIIISPLLSLAVVALVVALGFVSKRVPGALLGGFLLPWVILLLFLVSLPTIGAVIRRYRLPDEIRRNHALEHGTIHFLRAQYGKRYKLSGRSDANGFRVSGAPKAADIERAFAELQRQLKAGNSRVVVARRRGSNVVTAQAVGLVLMGFLALSIPILSLEPREVLLALAAILVLVVLVRFPLGNWVQERRFLLLDFSSASIVSIHPINRAELFERHPVFFVRTQIMRKAS